MVEVECQLLSLENSNASFSEDLGSSSGSSSSDCTNTSSSEEEEEKCSLALLEFTSNPQHHVIEETATDRHCHADTRPTTSTTSTAVVSDRKRSYLDSATLYTGAGPSAVKQSRPSFYVKLAQESPWNSSREEEDASYDSYNERETDVCRDSSDTEADYTTNDDDCDYDQLDNVEYEIAPTTDDECDDDSDSLCSESSVADSEEIVIATLTTKDLKEMLERELDSDSSSGDSSASEFAIFADFEESEDGSDPELCKADYWECVKCKNKQNNPRYRYCERCYQVRKSHFPPRPKKKQIRRERKRSNTAIRLEYQAPSSPAEGNFHGFSGDDGSHRADSPDSVADHHLEIPSTAAQILGKHSYSVVGSSGNHSINGNGRASRVQKRKVDSAGEASSAATNTTDSDASVGGGIGAAKKVSPKRRRLSRQTPVRASSLVNGNCSASPAMAARLTPIKARRDLSELVNDNHDAVLQRVVPAATSLKDVVDAGAVGAQSSAVMSALTASKSCEASTKDLSLDLVNKQLTGVQSQDSGFSSGFSSGGSQDLSPSFDESPPFHSASSELESQETVIISEEKTYVPKPLSATSSNGSDIAGSDSENCKICSNSTKGAVFVHTNKACSGCCYSCAVKVWKKYKKCPFCTLKPKNVMKLFSH